MQKGFATLEIILAIMIVAVLVKVAVLNAVKIIDRASLEYETKRFYSELRFLQSKAEANSVSKEGMGDLEISGYSYDQKLSLEISADKKSYQIFSGASNKTPLRDPHYFCNGVTINFEGYETVAKTITLTFDGEGKIEAILDDVQLKQGTLIFLSRLGKERKIVFNNVGRIRGER